MTYTYNENCKAGAVYNIVTEVPIRGLSTINSVTSPNSTCRFKVAPNTVDFGDWRNNGQSVSVDQRFDPVIEIEYRPTQDVVNPVFTISGTVSTQWSFIPFDDTAYRDIDTTSYEFEKLWLNLFRKLYYEGIVPNFVERESPAYVPYFKTVAILNALNITLSEYYFGDLTGSRLRQYLEQKSLLICENADEEKLQEIKQRQIAILRDRGSVNLVDELKEYLCSSGCDAFMFEYAPRFMSGWTLDRTSPNFRGREHYQLNLAPTKGPGVYSGDFLGFSGNVVYGVNAGLAFLVDEEGDRILLSEDLDILDYDGGRIILEFEENRDVVCLSDVPYEGNFLLQENLDYLLQEESVLSPDGQSYINVEGSRIELEPTLFSVSSNPSVWFDVCPNMNGDVDWELRFWARIDAASGISVTISDPTGRDILLADGGIAPVNELFLVEEKRFPKFGRWVQCRIPIRGTRTTDNPMPDLPKGFSNYCKVIPPPTEKATRLRITFINAYTGNLCLHKISFGPITLDTNGARLDAYNAATLVFNDKNQNREDWQLNETVTNYLLPYGSTFSFKKYN